MLTTGETVFRMAGEASSAGVGREIWRRGENLREIGLVLVTGGGGDV